jgi:hypothetical protein
MQTAEFNHNDFDNTKQNELDKKLLVKFEYKKRPDIQKSAEEGREVLKDVIYVDIKVPGSKEGACRPARSTDIERFPLHYQAFMNRTAPPETGTPLSSLPFMNENLISQFSFMEVKTVEQLAGLNDNACGQIMGGYGFKVKAKEYIEFTRNLQEYGDKKQLKEENVQLKEQMTELMARLDALEGKNEPEQAADASLQETKTVPNETAAPESVTNELKCSCGKVCKSANGLKIHKRACKKK